MLDLIELGVPMLTTSLDSLLMLREAAIISLALSLMSKTLLCLWNKHLCLQFHLILLLIQREAAIISSALASMSKTLFSLWNKHLCLQFYLIILQWQLLLVGFLPNSLA